MVLSECRSHRQLAVIASQHARQTLADIRPRPVPPYSRVVEEPAWEKA